MCGEVYVVFGEVGEWGDEVYYGVGLFVVDGCVVV